MMTAADFFGFLGTQTGTASSEGEEKQILSLSLATSLERARELVTENQSTTPVPQDSAPSHEPLEQESKSLALFKLSLERAVETNLAQRELVTFTHFASTHVADQLISDLVLKPAIKVGTKVETGPNFVIYGLDKESFRKAFRDQEHYSHMRSGLTLLPAAALMSSVSAFDSVIAEVFRSLLLLSPERYFSSDQTIPLSDLASAESYDQLRQRILDDETYRFTRGSHDEQVKVFETKFNVEVRNHWKRWPDFIEIFERRNLVAHGEKSFTERYVSICEKAGNQGAKERRGQPVKLSVAYLDGAQDLMLEFSILLFFSVWRKQFKEDEPKAFEALSQCTYNLIRKKRYRVAERVLEYALSLKTQIVSEAVRRTMTINLASTYKHQGKEKDALKSLDGMDWSACSDRYVICVEALRDNVDRVLVLMERVAKSNDVSVDEFQEWPLFSFVRRHSAFQERFRDIFGTHITGESRIDQAPDKRTATPDVTSDDLTETPPESADTLPN